MWNQRLTEKTFSDVHFRQLECPSAAGDLVSELVDLSVRLLQRHRAGDQTALRELLEALLQPMRQWARGRLPRWARDEINTDDLVQDALMHTMTRLDEFTPRHDGALQTYLRRAILHRIRDEIRRTRRQPTRVELSSGVPEVSPSPEDDAAATELFEVYEAARLRLREEDRELIDLRVDLELPYRDIARITGRPSEGAAQMAVSRALVRLAREMGRET
jgi:RNA polymerase sigma factor (sigma-70 family)